MRYAAIFALFCAAFLFAGCLGDGGNPSTGASNLADVNQWSARINTTGIVGPYELHNAYSRHVFTVWTTNATTLVNSTTFNATTSRSCTNTTINATNRSCDDTSTAGGFNFTTYKAATTYSVTLLTLNESFNNSTGLFDMKVYGCNQNQMAFNDTAYIYLYNTQNSLWYNTTYSLQANTSNWTNITGLSKAMYISSTGNITVKFEAGTSGANASNAGILIDYLAFNGSSTASYTSNSTANVSFQTSLDNRNWFTDLSVVNISAAQRLQTNQTALYARFNVTAISVPQGDLDSLYIQYVAVSN
jgi:hypothetical protein